MVLSLMPCPCSEPLGVTRGHWTRIYSPQTSISDSEPLEPDVGYVIFRTGILLCLSLGRGEEIVDFRFFSLFPFLMRNLRQA